MGHGDEYRLRANLRALVQLYQQVDEAARMQATIEGMPPKIYRSLKDVEAFTATAWMMLNTYLDEAADKPETRAHSDAQLRKLRTYYDELLKALRPPDTV